MEAVIKELEEDLINIINDKPTKVLRKKLKDDVDIRMLRMVIFSLQWASVGYQAALRMAGMKLGRRIGENSEKIELSLGLEEIKKIMETLRMGKVETEIILDLKVAVLKIEDSALTASIPDIQRNLCFFEEGFIEGYFDGMIFKKGALKVRGGETSISKVNVEEQKCIGSGEPSCEFLIKF